MLGCRVVATIPDGGSTYWETLAALGEKAGLPTVANDDERAAQAPS